jgi:alcohol dehydrogenase
MADRAVAQALVLEAPRRLVVRELPLPNLGDDDAEDLLATRAGERDDVPPVQGVLTP